jgi:Flp pilus assembly protein TadD
MSRTPVYIATALLLAVVTAGPAMAADPAAVQDRAQAAATPAAPAPRAPADAATRAAYDRADALSRSVFWTDQANLNPRDIEAGLKAAQALREMGRYPEAAEAAGKVLMVQPGQYDALLEVGRDQIAAGQAFYGIAALEQARDVRPDDWRPLSLLGTAYQQVRRPDDARAAWARALQLSPDNPDVLTNMAMAQMSGGDVASAEPLLRRAAAQPGASLKVRLNLAMALGLGGKFSEAEQILRRDLPPDQADRNLAWLREHAAGPSADNARTWNSLQGG